MSFGKTRPKKRVTFSKATLAAYNEKMQTKRIDAAKLPQLAGITFSKRPTTHKKLGRMNQARCSNSLQQLQRRSLSIGHATTTA